MDGPKSKTKQIASQGVEAEAINTKGQASHAALQIETPEVATEKHGTGYCANIHYSNGCTAFKMIGKC